MRGIQFVIPLLLLAIITVSSQDADYALYIPPEGGFATINPFDFGDRTYTIMAHARVENFNNEKTLFHAYRSTTDLENDLQVKITLVGSNRLRLKFGKTEVLTGQVLSIQANKMFSLIIAVSDNGAGINVDVYLNNNLVYSNSLNAIAATGVRSAHLGSDSTGNNRWIGVIDNFLIFHGAVSAAERQSHTAATKNWNPSATMYGSLALYVDFDDSSYQLENTGIAVVDVNGYDAEWVEVYLHNGASFTIHIPKDEWTQCSAWGDPHGVRRGSKIPGVESQKGAKIFLACVEGEVEVRTYARYKCWWGAAVATAIVTRYQDYLWRINLDERHSSPDDTRPGHPYSRLGFTPGAWMRHIHATNWVSIPNTMGTIIHPETGVRYSFNGNQLDVTVPGTLHTRALSPEGLYGRYINWYVDVNEAVCQLTHSTCTYNVGVPGNIEFRDWLPPVNLPDIDTVGDNPCANVDQTVVDQINRACGLYYPSKGDLYEDCRYDACTAGDPDIIGEVDLTPECMMERLTSEGESSPSCELGKCHKNCYGRGDCNPSTGMCENCDAGYTGYDCYQQSQFNCFSGSYGSVSVNIEPTKVLNMLTVEDTFSHYTVTKSLLIDPVTRSGIDYLKFVVSSPDNANEGSARVCINTNAGADPTNYVEVAKPSSSTGLGQVKFTVIKNTGSLCVSMNWPKFTSGGFFIELSAGSDYTIAVDQKVNLNQVLMSSKNGRGGVDVLKVPSDQHNNIGFVVENCDNTVCAAQDNNCDGCYNIDGCGFCQETQRCMRGDSTGPKRGVCLNWRYKLDDDISRVVTTIYDSDDLVDPSYEVLLGSIASNSVVPVNIYVPTGRVISNVDIYFGFGTAGSYALYAPQLKSNLISALKGIPSALALGYYSATSRKTVLPPTIVDANNQYVFGRAMEAPSGFATSQNGGQLELLNLIAGTAQSFLPRANALKLALIMTYDIPTDLSGLATTRSAVLNKNFLPIWLIPVGVDQSVVNFYQDLSERIDGIPSLIVRVEPSGSNFESVIRNVLRLANAFPYIVMDQTDDQYTNVDITTLSGQSDSLSIVGLTNSKFRARFVIPMKPSSIDNYLANIYVPSYGKSTIQDVPSIVPTSNNLEFSADEGVECLEIVFEGTTFKPVVSPIFEIITDVTKGTLHKFTATGAGDNVTVGAFTSGKLCFVPANKYDYADGLYTSFTYSTTDGCQRSTPSTVSIFINAVINEPIGSSQVINIDEDEQDQINFSVLIDVTALDADRDINGNLEDLSFNYTEVSKGVFFAASAPLNFGTDYSPITPNPTTFIGTHQIEFIPLDKDAFGTFSVLYEVEDPTGLVSNQERIDVVVTPVNDDPVFVNFADKEHQYTQEDTEVEVVIDFRDVDNDEFYVDALYVSGNGDVTMNGNPATKGEWITDACVATGGNVRCKFVVMPALNENSCSEDFTGRPVPQDLSILCPTPYAEFKFRATDKNSLIKPHTAGVSGERSVFLHVFAVNDKPNKPADRTINLKEDQLNEFVQVLAEDLDSIAADLDIFVTADFDSLKVVELYQSTGSGAKDIKFTGSDAIELNDYNLKRGSQKHSFFIDTLQDKFGVAPNWEIEQTLKVRAWDGELYSDEAIFRINVKPINDEPINVAPRFSFLEDECTNPQLVSDRCIFTFAASDVDNDYSDLTFTLLDVPDYSSPYGVSIFSVEGNGQIGLQITSGQQLTADDSGLVKLFIVTQDNWYGNFELNYTITDKDNYLDSSDADYKVNTITTSTTVEVVAVNDAPELNYAVPSAEEDKPVEISLAGRNNLFGEEDDVLEAVIIDINIRYPNSDVSNSTGYYRFSQEVFDEFEANPFVVPVNAIPIQVGDVIDETEEFKMIFVPAQNFNAKSCDYNSPKNTYCLTSHFRYQIRESVSHTGVLLKSPVSSQIPVRVSPVNDIPVVFGDNQWPLSTPEVNALYGITTETWPCVGCENICYENCLLEENLGETLVPGEEPGREPIFFGGRDIEFSTLSVVVTNIDCLSGASIYTAADATVPLANTQIGATFEELTLDCEIAFTTGSGYPLTDCLYFQPKANDWNVMNDDEEDHPNDQSGAEEDYYCEITYVVVDENGGRSSDVGSTFTITINVVQVNTQPIESFESLNGVDISGSIPLSQITSYSLTTEEDSDIFVYLNAVDVEDDDYKVRVKCSGGGEWFLPSVDQHNYINNSILDLSQNFDTLFEGTAVACGDFVQLSNKFYATNQKGWYLRYNSGSLTQSTIDYPQIGYSTLIAEYDDDTVDGQLPTTSTRTVDVIHYNRNPFVTINSGSVLNTTYGGVTQLEDPLVYNLQVEAGTEVNLALSYFDRANPLANRFGPFFRYVVTEWPEYNVDFTTIGETVNDFGLFEFLQTVSPLLEYELIYPADLSELNDGAPHKWYGFQGKAEKKGTDNSKLLNDFIGDVRFVPKVIGEYQVEFSLMDRGYIGYCSPTALANTDNINNYAENDVRRIYNFIDGQPAVFAGVARPEFCQRTTNIIFKINVVVPAATMAGTAMSAAGGILLIGAIVGAVIAAKSFKPAETDAWNAIGNADVSHMEMSAIHEAGTFGGTNQTYQSRDSIVN